MISYNILDCKSKQVKALYLLVCQRFFSRAAGTMAPVKTKNYVEK